jgi:hypothetical protein
MRRKELTVGDVINEMQFGELAIPTKVGSWFEQENKNYIPSRKPVHFRDSDGILVALGDSIPLVVGKAKPENTGTKYMIVSKEEYETYRDTGVLPE